MNTEVLRHYIERANDQGLLNWMPDKYCLYLLYWARTGKRLNLKNPQTYSEKLQWLKLYNRKPEYTMMVDKYEVKKYIAEKIGEEYVIPTLGVWDRFEDIDFDALPDRFVLKCTHNSGGLEIVKDKNSWDKAAAKQNIEKTLKQNYYLHGREWPYKNVKPRIIAEKWMADKSGQLVDFKFYCFHGQADCVMLCLGRETGDTKFYFFDKAWNFLRLNKMGLAAPEGFTIPKPEGMDKMFEIAEILSEELPYSRIDLYNVDGKIYFGEITFFPSGGFSTTLLKEVDERFGGRISLDR